jgi:shikimate kinase
VDEERALALVGFMGCGKSTVGRLVAERTGAPYRDLDDAIEERAGTSIAELFRVKGEGAFRALEAELLPQVLAPGTVASLGGGVPIDAANWELITGKAVTVWLDVPLDQLLTRAQAENGTRPMLAGRTQEQVRDLYEIRRARYAQASHIVDGSRDAAAVAEEVVRLWRR